MGGGPKPRKSGAPKGGAPQGGAPEGWGPKEWDRKGAPNCGAPMGGPRKGAPKGWGPDGGAPKGWGPNLESGAPKGGAPKRWGPKRWGTKRWGPGRAHQWFRPSLQILIFRLRSPRDIIWVGSTQPPSSGTESVPSDPEDFGRPRAQGVPAQVGSPHNQKSSSRRTCRSSLSWSLTTQRSASRREFRQRRGEPKKVYCSDRRSPSVFGSRRFEVCVPEQSLSDAVPPAFLKGMNKSSAIHVSTGGT